MTNSDSNIPYYEVNEECLNALNSVIWKAWKVEWEATDEVLDKRSQIKAKEDQVYKLEKELNNLWELNSNSLFHQYMKITEENSCLIKDRNMLEY